MTPGGALAALADITQGLAKELGAPHRRVGAFNSRTCRKRPSRA